MAETIILASGSSFRKELLLNAGVPFEAVLPQTDERAVEATLDGTGATPDEVALVLAEAKALDVGARFPDALVIGADQTLSLEDVIFHKPRTMEEARRTLLALSGQTHHLNTAAVLVVGGETVWRHVEVARMTMRQLDPGFVGRHLAAVGDLALKSVGAYQIEGRGVQLFDKIEGDTFSIVGLPLLPLLAALRRRGAIDG